METRLTAESKLSPGEVIRDDSLRAALFIVASLQIFQAFSPGPVEAMYTVTIHTRLGLTVEQSMQLNFVVHLISAPLRLMGTLLMDRYGRRFVFCAAAGLGFSRLEIQY